MGRKTNKYKMIKRQYLIILTQLSTERPAGAFLLYGPILDNNIELSATSNLLSQKKIEFNPQLFVFLSENETSTRYINISDFLT